MGHADRTDPLRNYCTGLLLDGERKSVEPMAARLAPDHVQSMHESLHHFVAQSPWSDADMVQQYGITSCTMQKIGPVTAWIVDETGFVKRGTHSVGVARQYCGRVGKTENCQVAVSLSVATATGSFPIAWRLYLPEEWVSGPERRKATDIPEWVQFQTKPQIALAQIRQAVENGVSHGVVLADEVYGTSHEFREGVAQLKLDYSLAVSPQLQLGARAAAFATEAVEGEGAAGYTDATGPDPPTVYGGATGAGVPEKAWREVAWREGSKETLRSRFAALRVRPAYGDDCKGGLLPEQWLLIEWPTGAVVPSGYWLASLPAKTSLRRLVE